MSRINEKMGLRPAGKRSMMKLPDDKDYRNKLTAARCPGCNRTGVREMKTRGETRWFCSWGCGQPSWVPTL